MILNFLVACFLCVLCVAGIFATLLGLFLLFQLMRPKKHPADASNRINHIRLVWFAMTRPQMFVPLFSWLANDELVNVTGKSNEPTKSPEQT